MNNNSDNMKALYIVVNAGFAEEIVELVRTKGAAGATIINARGISSCHKEIMGISIDADKEMILTLTDSETAEKIMDTIKQNYGFKSPAHGICFALPVTKTVGLSQNLSQLQDINK
ncbi:MAG: P-II family nitrogen regulator [Anaerocolumna aminovalerica]|uniref:P-II family nitrogen regulator n=1 Tax=Anaerocolumna aminovalerica TaxID=1527 RepID=UPI00248CAAB3|nr:P-II family nitrogen regulator [Anaerocolumna aminovalerica]MDU6264591.1 P-II family nitrogen regulator [Anaerocolumna aminovalerica]